MARRCAAVVAVLSGLVLSAWGSALPIADGGSLLHSGSFAVGEAPGELELSSPLLLPQGALHGFNLLLVTVDTLRADVLGSYGGPEGLTPELDGLAAEGIRFDSAFAHAPMTLPSHASILTGEYPFRHGVRDNGAFRLDGSRVTLAEMLRQAGYRTGAFVGSFILDARFGLGQGFDVYDDYYGEKGTSDAAHFKERRADQVLAPATSWIEQDDGRWFAWVHLFDPHVPYEPPAPYLRGRQDQPYQGEVAYVDTELGRFLEGLRASGALDNALVVFTADHGESLGEHGEQTHGAFAYNSTLRVPLILWAGAHMQPGVFSAPVGHVDVVPTVLELLGLSVPDSLQGTSLLAVAAAGEANGGSRESGPGRTERNRGGRPPIYFEALNGYFTQNLAPLTGLVDGDYKFIDLPVPELYYLPTDPDELDNLFEAHQAIAARLRRSLEQQLEATAPRAGQSPALAGLRRAPLAAPDTDARRRLEALGYLTATSVPEEREFTAADDPKNALPLINKHRSATASFASGRPAEAISLLREVIEERPDFTIAYVDLASILYGTRRVAEAISVLETVVADEPDNARLAGKLGFYLATAGEVERAVRLLEAALERAPDDVEILAGLADIYSSIGRQDDAHALLARALELDPSSAGTHYNLGLTYARAGAFATAIEQFRRAIELGPDFWPAYEGLGSGLAQTDQLAEAVDAWKKSVELNPGGYDALYNLGVGLAVLGRDEEALIYLERFISGAPPDRYVDKIKEARAIAAQIRGRIRV